MGVAKGVCMCAHTCTRAQLTQSEKCCMATVHKGTRLCICMCQMCSCLYVWMGSEINRVSLCVCLLHTYLSVFLYLSAPHSSTEPLHLDGFYITPYSVCSREEAWIHNVCLTDIVTMAAVTSSDEHRW